MSTPLEELAMIGDGETVALVSRRGTIEWLCLPRFDSPACCSALLGTDEHGYWSIAPETTIERAEHRYRTDTLILETELTTADGTIRLTDFMPIRCGDPALVRIVTGIEGTVPTRLNASFRFDYGNMPPWVTEIDGGAVMHVGPDKLVLHGSDALQIASDAVTARFTVEAGSTHAFVLRYGAAHDPNPEPIAPAEALEETQHYWEEWIGRFDDGTEHRAAVRRSLLTLKALIHRPTGGLVAAPTTSLPEQPGGSMNWDYRYCWLRDATFTLSALVGCGYLDEAAAWRDWILRAVAGAPDKMQIMYRVDGSRRLDEAELPWLPGYQFARPVRVGNAAAGQLQLDVYGELINTLHTAERAGMARTDQGRHLEHAIVEHVAAVWGDPDKGPWESRGQPRHYTYSKVMAWVALDRYLAGCGGDELPDEKRWTMRALRDHIREVICRDGFNPGLGSFTSYFGGQEVDASLLLLPKVGFLPANDERMLGTVRLIERTLVDDGLVRRHLMNDIVPEGAFLACSFWLAECQFWQGRHADAVRSVDRALATRSDLGLLSEEYDVASRRLTGNFPQALSHLALINAVLTMSGAEGKDDAG